MAEEDVQPESAFRFHGQWQEFAAIVFPNLLLTLVTLGIYRFWATTREREYLWSKTDFIDERLEWTGRGIELFIGFVLVFLLIGLPLIVIQLVANGLIFRGHTVLVGVMSIVLFVFIFYLTGVAYFRALRYRLSRTYWRGIRGGSNDPGFFYGLSYMWKHVAAALTLFLMWPWATVSLWNERWNAMSFGPHPFVSNVDWTPLMRRYLLFYLVPFLAFVGGVIFAVTIGANADEDPGSMAGIYAVFFGIFMIFIVLAFYVLLPVAALLFYSKYYRNAVAGLRLHKLEFAFTARAADWILFFLANMVIWGIAFGVAFIPVSIYLSANAPAPGAAPDFESWAAIATGVVTLLLVVFAWGMADGIIRYRSWRFFINHMEAYGEINIDELTQSATASPKQGEGLLDAFDVGAI